MRSRNLSALPVRAACSRRIARSASRAPAGTAIACADEVQCQPRYELRDCHLMPVPEVGGHTELRQAVAASEVLGPVERRDQILHA